MQRTGDCTADAATGTGDQRLSVFKPEHFEHPFRAARVLA
jgi:hypothetical protein